MNSTGLPGAPMEHRAKEACAIAGADVNHDVTSDMSTSKEHRNLRLPALLARARNVPKLQTSDRLVLVALQQFEDWTTHKAFPSQDVLAMVTGLSRSTVIASLRRLASTGLIHREANDATGGYTYTLPDTRDDADPFAVFVGLAEAKIAADPTRARRRQPREARPARPAHVRASRPAPEQETASCACVASTDLTPAASPIEDEGPVLEYEACEHVEAPVVAPADQTVRSAPSVVESCAKPTVVVAPCDQVTGDSVRPERSLTREEKENPPYPPRDVVAPLYQTERNEGRSDQPESLLGVEPVRRTTRTRNPAFSPEAMGQAFVRGAGSCVTLGPMPGSLARRLWIIARDLDHAGYTLDSVERAGRLFATKPERYRGLFGWSWLVQAGRLLDLVAHAEKLAERTTETRSSAVTAARRSSPEAVRVEMDVMLKKLQELRMKQGIGTPERTRTGERRRV